MKSTLYTILFALLIADLIDRLQKRMEKLKADINERQELEASICPEDVGFAEYVKCLQKQVEKLKKSNERLINDKRDLQIVCIRLRDERKAKEEKVERLKGLLRHAKCPNCDGSGCIPRQVSSRQYATREMAIDAGDESLEGSLYSDDQWEAEQCQWCYEKEQALKGDK